MQVQFCGANGEVTGSSHLLSAGMRQILLDCGMIQGDEETERRNAEPFPFDPQRLDALVLSHAHIDHVGRVRCAGGGAELRGGGAAPCRRAGGARRRRQERSDARSRPEAPPGADQPARLALGGCECQRQGLRLALVRREC